MSCYKTGLLQLKIKILNFSVNLTTVSGVSGLYLVMLIINEKNI